MGIVEEIQMFAPMLFIKLDMKFIRRRTNQLMKIIWVAHVHDQKSRFFLFQVLF